MNTTTADMKVARVIHQCPEAVEIFLRRECPGMRSGFFNMMAHLMSVRNATRIHAIDLAPLLEELNNALHKKTEA